MMMERKGPEPAPAPYTWAGSGRPGGNGLFNLYIMDANGRKIAAVWGKPGEKEKTASLFSAAPVMIDALRYCRLALNGRKKMSKAAKKMLEEVDAAIALADGRNTNGESDAEKKGISRQEAPQEARR